MYPARSSSFRADPMLSVPSLQIFAKPHWMRERESYRELILENIEYDYLCRDDRLDRDKLRAGFGEAARIPIRNIRFPPLSLK